MWNIKIIFIIPVCLIAGGFYSLASSSLFLFKAIETTGYVSELKQSTRNTYSTDKQGYKRKTGRVIEYQPIIRFTTKNGKQLTFNSLMLITGKSERYYKYRSGRKVSVLYDAQYPVESARINSFSAKWGITLFLFAFGILGIIICRWILRANTDYHKQEKDKKADKEQVKQKNTIQSQEYKKPAQIKVNVIIFTFIMLCLIYAAVTDSYTSDKAAIFMIALFLIPFFISWYLFIKKRSIFHRYGESLCVLETFPVKLGEQFKGHIKLNTAYPSDIEYQIQLRFNRYRQEDFSESLIAPVKQDLNGLMLFFQFTIPDTKITVLKDEKEFEAQMTSDTGTWLLTFTSTVEGQELTNSYTIPIYE